MNTKNPTRLTLMCSAVFLFCFSTLTSAADPAAVELFDAMKNGQVNVKFIPANSFTANVLIENKTDKVLHVELPDAIAAVPVLAQLGQQFGQQQGGGGGGGGNQSVGGGMNGGGNGGQQRGGIQGGFMRIAPQKTRKLKATTVCMEYGKPDPNPRVAYKMIPVTELTKDKNLIELCERLGKKEVDQKIAQAVAWHLANGLDWKQLAKINRLQSRYLGNVPLFTASHLKKAKELVETLTEQTSDQSADRYVLKN